MAESLVVRGEETGYSDTGLNAAGEVEDRKARGHNVRLAGGPNSHDGILILDPQTGLIRAAGDPKTKRHAAAF